MSLGLRHAVLGACIALVTATAAAGGMGAGALGGAGDALQQIGRDMQNESAQRDLIEQQHRLEMERMQRQFELQQQAQRQAAQAAQQQAAQKAAKDAAVDAQIEAVHPGWKRTVRTAEFGRWTKAQPTSVQRLGASTRVEDAMLMLDLFERDHPNWQAAK